MTAISIQSVGPPIGRFPTALAWKPDVVLLNLGWPAHGLPAANRGAPEPLRPDDKPRRAAGIVNRLRFSHTPVEPSRLQQQGRRGPMSARRCPIVG
jgi:hypothetical protein